MPLTNSQQEIMSSRARFKVVAAGRRFGKSFLSMSLMGRHGRFPNSNVWYVTTTYSAAKTIMWNPLKEKLKTIKWSKGFHEVAMQAHLINGSVISLKGTNNPDSLRGIGLDYLVVDEAAYIDERVWTEVLRPTLSDRQGGALFISSPTGRNWFYDLYQYAQTGEDDDWESWQFTTLEGGNVPPDEIESAKRDLDERTFRQEYEAKFVTYSGLVYYGFDYQENVIDCPYNPDEPVLIGMDFNIDPMTATIFQYDEEEQVLYVVDEVEIFGSNTDEMAEEILCRYPEQQIVVYPDPACVQTRTSAGTNVPEKGGEKDYSHITDSIGYLVEYIFPINRQEMSTTQVLGV